MKAQAPFGGPFLLEDDLQKLMKVLGLLAVSILLLIGAAFWWLSALSDVPHR